MPYFPSLEVEALSITGTNLFINWNKCGQVKINHVHRAGGDIDALCALGAGSIGSQWFFDHLMQQ